jgi:3-oxoacyl-[acyl-carrier protein] reductase
MTIDLTDRVVVITGGSQGLGKAMALGLAKAGASIVLASPDRDRLNQVADAIGRKQALPVTADITRDEDCASVVDQAIKAFGHLDVVINNARRIIDQQPGEFWKASPAFWRDSVLVNVYGTFLMTRAAVPHMIERGWGRIINHSTGVATMQRRLNSPYGPTKAAIDSETLIWAKDLRGTGVTVNAILPGAAVDSETRALPPLSGRALISADIIVPPVLWLCSTLSDGHTGERYMGKKWDRSLPWDEAAAKARTASPIVIDPDEP